MIVRKGVQLRAVVLRKWRSFALMVCYATVIVAIGELGGVRMDMPTGIAAILGTALSILLGFRTNSAYARWWEARQIWGGIVNDSRTFARQVLTLIAPPSETVGAGKELAAFQTELIHRQIAWNWILNRSLRGQEPFEPVRGLLAPEEIEELTHRESPTTALLVTQGKRLANKRTAGWIDSLLLVPLDATLKQFSDHMGKCERIKKTTFPSTYSGVIIIVLILFYILLVPALVDHLGWAAIPVATFVGSLFAFIETISNYLQDPFENLPTDTPMNAICRTIEANLRQELGEKDLPPPVEVVNGVLM